MINRSPSMAVTGLLLSYATVLLAQPAASLDANYWRGGWRTPLGDEPHIYEFVIRGRQVTGVYCRNCSDATTIGFIDGTFDDKVGIDFTVTFANLDGRIRIVDRQHAMLDGRRLVITRAGSKQTRNVLTLIKDPRGADPGGAPAYHLPPGTPPALPEPRPAGGGGGGARGLGPPYWQPGPFKALRPADLVGTWIAPFGLGMNKQLFTFLRVGDRLRGVVCGRCDNPYTTGAIENVLIAGNTLYFDIVHEDWGESDPPTFHRNIVAQVVQNEMIAATLGKDLVINLGNPPARPARGGFTLLGPIVPEATRGNSSEGIDVWGPGTGSAIQPPSGRTPIVAPTQAFSAQDAGHGPNQCASSPAIVSVSSPSWNAWGADAGNTRFQPASAAQLSVADIPRLKLKWTFGFPGARAVSGQPVIVAGRVFVSADTGEVYALDSLTGCVYWSFHAEAAVRSAVTVERPAADAPYAVFFGDARANVYAVDAARGTPLWKVHVDDHPLARITGGVRVFEGRVYVPVASGEEGAGGNPAYACCTSRGSVVALNAKTGTQAWKTYAIPDAPKPTTKNAAGTQLWGPSGAGVWNSPTIDARRRALYVGTGNAYSAPAAPTTDAIVAMDLDSGKILWSAQGTADDVWVAACINKPAPNCGPDQDFGSPPILKTISRTSLLIAGQKSGNVWAYDPDKKGAVVWRSPLVSNTTEFGGKIVWGGAADEENAYFGLGPGGVVAVRLRDGQRQWFASLQPTGSPARLGQDGALTVIPGAVISGGWDGVLRVLSSADGHTLWEYNTARDFETVNHVDAHGGSMGAPGPVVAGGLLVVPSGYVGVRNGAPGNVLLVFGVER